MKKRIVLIMVFAIVLVAGYAVPVYANFMGVINTDNVNLRAMYSGDAEVIGTLNKGDEIATDWFKSGWYRVKVLKTHQVGWVWGQYITPRE